MKLYFSRNPNPRLAVTVARYLDAKVEFEFASPFAPGQAEKYRPLNPNLSLPILVDDEGKSLWEADAIACRLSRDAHSDFWRTGDDEPEMIRWLSWGKEHFASACDTVHFERGTKQRYGIGPIDQKRVEEGLNQFHTAGGNNRRRACRAAVAGREFDFLCRFSNGDLPAVQRCRQIAARRLFFCQPLVPSA